MGLMVFTVHIIKGCSDDPFILRLLSLCVCVCAKTCLSSMTTEVSVPLAHI